MRRSLAVFSPCLALSVLAAFYTSSLAFAQPDPRTPEQIEQDAARALDPRRAYADGAKLFAVVVLEGGTAKRPESDGLKALYRFYEEHGFRMTAVFPEGSWGGMEYGDATEVVVDQWGYHAKRLGVIQRPTVVIYDASGKTLVHGGLADLERMIAERFGPGPRPFTKSAGAPPPASAPPPQPAAPPPQAPPPPAPASPAKRAFSAGAIAAVLSMLDPNASDRKTRIDPRVLRDLTEQLRISLATAGVQTVERGQIIEKMKSESYKACVDESCQIPLGKALAASVIVRSQVTRFAAKRCFVSAEVIDLKKEVTVGAAKAESNCSTESLVDAVSSIARQLAGG